MEETNDKVEFDSGDPLILCLLRLTQLYRNPCTADFLLAGLPLSKGHLSTDLFIRAAERANIQASVVRKKINTLHEITVPFIALLNNHDACLVTNISDTEVTVIKPNLEANEFSISKEQFEKKYAGSVIITKYDYLFDSRSNAPLKQKSKRWFWSVVLHAWPIYGEVLIGSFFINLFALASPLFIMNVYDRVVPNQAIDSLWVLAIGVSIAYIFDFILRSIRAYFLDAAAEHIDKQLSARIFEQILGIEMKARPDSVGSLANTVQAFESFRDFVTSVTIGVLIDVPFTLLFVVIMILIGGAVAWVPLITMPLMLVGGFLIQAPLNKLVNQSYRHAAEKQAIIYETLSGIETIKSVRAESPLQRKWEYMIENASTNNRHMRVLVNLAIHFSSFIQQMTTIAVVIVGVYEIHQNRLSMGGLIACTILSGRALALMSQITGLLTRYRQSKAALNGVDSIMMLPVERPSKQKFLQREQMLGEIEFKNVSFAYDEQNKMVVLDNLNLHIHPKERIAILGRIGSGKSSLLKLLMKLYRPISGHILIDGADLSQIDPAQLRRFVGYVPQDVILFHGTIKDNIVFGAPFVSDAQIIKAAELSGAMTFINQHPQGFDREIGERGQHLSSGQRQAIALARALLLDQPILVFDEPSNAMDDSTVSQIIQQLKPILHEKTLIVVTHKPLMLNLVERVIVMDNGKIVLDGPKAQVIEKLSANKSGTLEDK